MKEEKGGKPKVKGKVENAKNVKGSNTYSNWPKRKKEEQKQHRMTKKKKKNHSLPSRSS